MKELKEEIAKLKSLMTPEVIEDLTDEEIQNLKALIEELKSMVFEDIDENEE